MGQVLLHLQKQSQCLKLSLLQLKKMIKNNPLSVVNVISLFEQHQRVEILKSWTKIAEICSYCRIIHRPNRIKIKGLCELRKGKE